MSTQIELDKYAVRINSEYVGFGLYKGRKVKPVHIANGVFRTLCGKVLDTKSLKQLVLVESKTGKPGIDKQTVYDDLIQKERIEDDISIEDFDATRRVIQRMLDADSGIFISQSNLYSDHMLSFSLSSKYQITGQALYEDAGEFIGEVVKEACPDLGSYIVELLEKADDPISLLLIPVASDQIVEDSASSSSFKSLFPKATWNPQMQAFMASVRVSGQCLLNNLRNQPNRFTQLRLFTLFCTFTLFRYIASLEAFYCNGKTVPILLDFSGKTGSIADASANTYASIRRSLSRFCSWAYSSMLKEEFLAGELLSSDDPLRKKGAVSKDTQKAISSMWALAKEEATKSDDNEYSIFGRTINNILAREADYHPGNYLRAVGLLPGLLYPPNSNNNRFVISQDYLEMLLMCTVEPDETVTGRTIRQRMWNNCGIIIGGSAIEETVVKESNLSLSVDKDALEHNFTQFAAMMEALGFAEVLADGILQICLGGA